MNYFIMNTTEILKELKENFNLKDNHILILKTLQEENLTADEICKKTNIPKGRIYNFLNELIENKLLEKTPETPATYTARPLTDRILEFFNYNFEKLMQNELKILSKIEKKEELESVDFITGSKQYAFQIIRMLSESERFLVVERGTSVSLLLYPQNKEEFHELRKEILRRRGEVLIAGSEKQQMLVKLAYDNAYLEGKKFQMAIYKEGIKTFLKSFKDALGKERLKEWFEELEKNIKEGKLSVKVIPRNLPFYIYFGENRMILVLYNKGMRVGLSLRSGKLDFIQDSFREIFNEGEKFIPFVKEWMEKNKIF